jgi:hypothetical protein
VAEDEINTEEQDDENKNRNKRNIEPGRDNGENENYLRALLHLPGLLNGYIYSVMIREGQINL